MSAEPNKSNLVNTVNEIRRMSCISNSSGFLRSFSLNSSGESSVLKRKFAEDSDNEGTNRKESRFGSPLMSPWEFRRLRTDLIDAQAQIVRLEDRIDQLHKKNKEAVILFDQEKSDMKTRLEASRKSVEALELKLQSMRAREAETRAEYLDLKKTLDTCRIDRNQRLVDLEQLESENAQLKLRLCELENHEDTNLFELKQEKMELMGKLERQRLTTQEVQEQADNAQSRLAVVLEDLKDVEEVKLQLLGAQNRVKELESERDEWEEARTVATVLQDRVLRLREVEKQLEASQEEVARLKIAVKNKVFLEERLHDLELKQSVSAAREKEYVGLKEKNFDLETELERWESFVESVCDSKSRDALRGYLNAINDKEVGHSMTINSLTSDLETKSAQLQVATNKLQVAAKAAEEMKTVMERTRTEVQLLRRKVALVTRERDSYREQLDLFEKDLTVSGLGAKTNEGGQQERVQELEAMLQNYREQMESLENQLALHKGDDAEARIEAMRKLEQELAQTRVECERLSARKDELEEMLEQRIKQGGYPSPSTRVLHFRNNPCAQAEQQQAADVEELRKECNRLKARVKLLESGEHLDLTTRAAAEAESSINARVKELEEQLESAMLKNTRLKEVFKRTSQDFRDVSYMLLGYRIDLISNKIYRLTNMYSEDPNDHFMFQLNRSGMMEMLETPFTETLPELVNEHLHENNSIPCFLSAVTLNLHSNVAESAPSEDSSQSENEPIEVEISD